MDRYDARRIGCPHCHAAIGDWCGMLLNTFGQVTKPVVGFVHSERHQLARSFPRAGAVPDGQRKLPGVD